MTPGGQVGFPAIPGRVASGRAEGLAVGAGFERPVYIISIGQCPQECPRAVMAATVPGEEDDYSPRAVRVHLGVKKLDKMSKSVDEMLHALKLGVETKQLAEVFGVRETAIYGCQLTASQEEVTNAPTLLQMKEESHNELGPKVCSSSSRSSSDHLPSGALESLRSPSATRNLDAHCQR